jgi:hemerythrin-like domain-containing protein
MTEVSPRLSQILGDDHRDLDEQWERIEATPASELTTRRELFGSFHSDLLRHIVIEEEELFPRMEAAGPSQRVLVAQLIDEHRRIKELLSQMEREVISGSELFDKLGLELINVLWAHNAREEASAYPWLDSQLSPAQVVEVERRLEHQDPP